MHRLPVRCSPTRFSVLLALICAAFAGPLSTALAQAPVEQTNIELILDASGSMFNRLDDGRYRIVAAKEVLADLIAGLPEQEDLNVGLRVYGSSMRAIAEGACEDTVLKVSVAGFDRQNLLDTVRGTQALGATPIALSLEQAAQDLPSEGHGVIVLITDGIESCRGDLREVAQAVRDQGIDLRIVGLDLDENAIRSFDGLGTFENATSAAELLAALTKAVEVEAVKTTLPVTVNLTREGAPASEGAVVTFSGTIGAEQHLFDSDGPGEFTAKLAAGSYTALVGDAFSSEPLAFDGLTVTAEGSNTFDFELAPTTIVLLAVADTSIPAGAIRGVTFEGAPAANGFLAVAPIDVDDYTWLSTASAEPDGGGRGSVELRLPDSAGDYELRYLVDLPEGGWGVIGRLAVSVTAVSADIQAPGQVNAGSRIDVSWTGPGNRDDFITIVPVDSDEGIWHNWNGIAEGSTIGLVAPEVAGEYEIRYVTGGEYRTLASVRLLVEAADASLSTVATARAGSTISIAWTGPANADDFITIVPVGTEEGTWNSWVPVHTGEGAAVRVSDFEGAYEIRYVSGNEYLTLARAKLTVTPASATLQVPNAVRVDEEFEVLVDGPFDSDDFITILPVGTEDGTWDGWFPVAADNIRIFAPSESGAYEVRYVTGQEYRTLTRAPLSVR